MATLELVVLGPSRGGPVAAHAAAVEVESLAEALEMAARVAAQRAGGPVSGPAPTVFINGRDARFAGEAPPPLNDGDHLTVVYPATDT